MKAPVSFIVCLAVAVGCGPTPGEAGSGTDDDGSEAGSGTSGSEDGTASGTGDGSESGTGDGSESTTDDDTEGTGPDCACEESEVCTPDGCRGGQLFIHFDGPMLVFGPNDDATQDQTSIEAMEGQMQPYGGDGMGRLALLDGVRDHFDGMSIYVGDQRPEEGEYTMIVLGDNLGAFNGALEISVLDCGNATPSSISFAGIHANDSLTHEERVTIVAHAAGHSYGLEHIASSTAIMAGALNPDPSFVTECTGMSASDCVPEHAVYCTPGMQNSWAELAGIFGEL
jgi:hypothetical protein